MSVTAPDGSVWPAGSLRALEHTSIREFVLQAAKDGYLKGRVLDWGCGSAPYKSIVEAEGGEWFGFDRAEFPDNHVGDVGGHPFVYPNHSYDAVLCTQVIQYVTNISEMLNEDLVEALRPRNGHLVMTYPTNWPEAQREDLFRFTASGIERLLADAGFKIIRHESRASFTWNRERFSLGGGVIARA